MFGWLKRLFGSKGKRKKLTPDHWPIPSNAIHAGWMPQEILLISWVPNSISQHCTVDKTQSGRYDISILGSGQVYNDIEDFARDVSGGVLPANKSDLYTVPGPHPASWDFVIEKSCYIVFVLQQPTMDWQFLRYSAGVMLGELPDNWYSDLLHLDPSAAVSSPQENGCKALYFKAYVDNSTNMRADHFTLFLQYGSQFTRMDFDPAIKNKGHTH